MLKWIRKKIMSENNKKHSVIGFAYKMLGAFCIVIVLLWAISELLGFYGLLAFSVAYWFGFAAGRITKGVK